MGIEDSAAPVWSGPAMILCPSEDISACLVRREGTERKHRLAREYQVSNPTEPFRLIRRQSHTRRIGKEYLGACRFRLGKEGL